MSATTVAISSGNQQAQAIVGDLLLPLKVLVTDAGGLPVSNQSISFAVGTYPTGATGQVVSASSALSDANGIAQVVATIGNVAGTYTFIATATGLTGSPLTFTEYGLCIVTSAQIQNVMAPAGQSLSATDLAVIMQIAGLATQKIESRLGQIVSPRPVTEYIDGSGSTYLYMNLGRIISIIPDPTTGTLRDSIQYRTTTDQTWTTLPDTDVQFFLDPYNAWCLEMLDYRIYPLGWKNIRVYHQAGFDPIPGDIQVMALEMTQAIWDDFKVGGNPRLGRGNFGHGAAGTNMSDSFKDLDMERWQKVIDRYKRYV